MKTIKHIHQNNKTVYLKKSNWHKKKCIAEHWKNISRDILVFTLLTISRQIKRYKFLLRTISEVLFIKPVEMTVTYDKIGSN